MSRLRSSAPRSDECKARTPKPFDGEDPAQLNTFILQTSLAFDARPTDFPDERSKIVYAISYLDGAALEWAYPLFRMTDPPPYMTDFPLFTGQLEQVFGDSDLVISEQLRGLKQTSTVAKYGVEFRRLANRAGWENRSLCSQFFSGLKHSVKLELARGKRPEKIEELINMATSIDHIQREGLTLLNPTPRPLDQPQRRDHRHSALSTASTSRRLTEQQREHRIKNNLCLYCGGEGHIIRTCLQRQPRISRASVAALMDTESPGNEQTQLM
jgi:Ty3 transposon capsid-like protein